MPARIEEVPIYLETKGAILMLHEQTLRLELREFEENIKKRSSIDWLGYLIAFLSLTATLLTSTFIDFQMVQGSVIKGFFYCLDMVFFCVFVRKSVETLMARRMTPEDLIQKIFNRSTKDVALHYFASDLPIEDKKIARMAPEDKKRLFADLVQVLMAKK